MAKFLILFFLAVLIVVVQVSFVATWPMPARAISLLVVGAVFAAVALDRRQAIFLAAALGLLIEPFSLSGFGLEFLSLLGCVGLVMYLAHHYFTNQSVYTVLSLTLIGALTYRLLFVIVTALLRFFGRDGQLTAVSLGSWRFSVWQIIFALVIVPLLFFGWQRFGQRYRRVEIFR